MLRLCSCPQPMGLCSQPAMKAGREEQISEELGHRSAG